MNLKPEEAAKLAEDLLDLGTSNGGEADLVGVGSGPVSLPGGRLGNYRVTRLVGTGGMGEVYEAEQDNPRRRVALKVIRSHLLSPDVRRRFEHEVRILGSLHHPGIAQIYEAGHFPSQGLATPDGDEAPTSPFFAMEFVQGEPLTSYAASRKLSPRERLELFLRVCQAVEHAHQRGIIHRDLKPANILVTPPPEPGADSKPASSLTDRLGQPKVLDFGVARATDVDVSVTSLRTEIGKLVGTLPYMSPEQASGDAAELDTRSDVYALGVVLYELLSGKLPYDVRSGGGGGGGVGGVGAGVANALRVIKEVDPAPLSTVDRVFRGDIETIVGKALEKERERRYQSVGELAADVRRYLADEPIVARRPTVRYQLRKLYSRHPGTVILAAGMVLALAAGVTSSAVLGAHYYNQRNEARGQAAEAAKQMQVARQANSLLIRVITSVDARKSGKDATIAEALEASAALLRMEGDALPEVSAALHSAVGAAYRALGRPQDAEPHARTAVERSSGIPGDNRDIKADCLMVYAEVLQDLGKLDLAVAASSESLRLNTAKRGPDDLMTQRVATHLAILKDAQGSHDEAAQLFRQLLKAATERDGEDDHNTLSIMHNLACALFESGQHEEAEELVKKELKLLRASVGDEHPDVINALGSLAGFQVRTDRAGEAEPLTRELVALHEKVYGADHPETLNARANLAGLLLEMGRHPEAELEARLAYEDQARVLGPFTPRTIAAMTTLAEALDRQNRAAEAEDLVMKLIRSMDDSADAEQQGRRAWVRMIYVRYAANSGQLDKGLQEGELALEYYITRGGIEHRLTKRCIDEIAMACEAVGRADLSASYRQRLNAVPAGEDK